MKRLNGTYQWKQGYGFEGIPCDHRFRSHQAAYGFLRRENRKLDKRLPDYAVGHYGVEKEGEEWIIRAAYIYEIR
jgi:hypothetical protein